MRRRTIPRYGAVGVGVVALTLFVGWWQVDGPGAPEPMGQRPMALSAMNFLLTDHENKEVGPKTLIGRPTMAFFGFTYCPDVCPTTLSDISGWLDDLGEDAERLNVVFITVDPERDTVETMAEYVGYFHPAIRGWTGREEQIARAADGFRVTYERVPTEGGDYTMNHTASVFLFDTAGRFVTMIDYHEPREFAVPKIRRALQETTGTATGPNLHYKVLVEGRPTEHLSDERLAEAPERDADDTSALSRLAEARALLIENLGNESAQTTTERL